MVNKRGLNDGCKINVLFLVVILSVVFFVFLSLVSSSLAASVVSNQSIQARESLDQAQRDIDIMVSKNISILRVNETYQEALQLYSAQMALEEKGRSSNYRLVIEYALEVSSTEKVALEANDELRVFKENYVIAEKSANLSAMQDDYNSIIISFNDERFEDTLTLINKGYDKISEIQSSQTAVNAVYSATSKTLKNFFIQNGLKIAIVVSVFIILLLVFWNVLTRLEMRIRLNNLIMRKKSINGLIKEMQASYFKTKKLSETEYKIKLKNYEELIRDIDRQVMVLKEEMFKMNKNAGNKLKLSKGK